jgi:hypothetical protein
MPRRDGDLPYAIEFSIDEREVLGQMQAMTGCTTIANLLRTALWHYSEHLNMDINLRGGVFDERHGSGTNKVASKRGRRLAQEKASGAWDERF